MKIFCPLILLISGMMLLGDEAVAQVKEAATWSVAARLPLADGMKKQLGVAGVFTGVSNDILIVAGGSNFENGVMPWEGGKKVYRDDIYVLKKDAGNSFKWLDCKTKHLPKKIAYGASVTVADGIVCAGGETGETYSADVFMMRWDEQTNEVQFTTLPSLPVALANACMTNIDNTVYLIGGESKGKPSSACYALDLTDKNGKWQILPALPVAMSHSVAVTQSNGQYPCVYVIGGRSGTPSGISTLHHSTYCFDPVKKSWFSTAFVGDETEVTNISAAAGVAYGRHEILLIGGDKGDIFHRIEMYNAQIAKEKNDAEKQRLQKEKAALLNNHPGFSKIIYVFNTVRNAWSKGGELPFYGQVTTTAVLWDGQIIIPCGEIKPGTRTPDLTLGIMNPAQ